MTHGAVPRTDAQLDRLWALADREAPWDVEDGEELTLYPLGGDDDRIIASTQQMDWIFARLPAGDTCP